MPTNKTFPIKIFFVTQRSRKLPMSCKGNVKMSFCEKLFLVEFFYYIMEILFGKKPFNGYVKLIWVIKRFC